MSRRDFWRILTQLREENVAILVTTAYLDEAERCDRVGLIDQGRLLAIGSPKEIKKLMDGRILAIRSDQARQMVSLFQEQTFCKSVNLFGDTVHLLCDNIRETENQVTRLLRKEARFSTDTGNSPSLEDVFVSLLGKTEKNKTPPTPATVLPPPAVKMTPRRCRWNI